MDRRIIALYLYFLEPDKVYTSSASGYVYRFGGSTTYHKEYMRSFFIDNDLPIPECFK